MATKPGHQHVGACSTGTVFTRGQAVEQLALMGFTFNAERGDYERGEERGRLAWRPDYCDADNPNVGTWFYLQRPHGAGEIPVLGVKEIPA